jgi:phenylpropionate dioxygenase-like ring-hydroxylating dioxygenase large terminal subunit
MDGHQSPPAGNDPRGIGRVAETLLSYAETKTTFQGAAPKTIPAEHYTDPARFAREKAALFMRLPLVVGVSGELPVPGSYKALDAMGHPVLLTRDCDGQVRAFLNVCPHRGAPVAAEGCGRAARLTCPYHAWSFTLTGDLLAVAGADMFGPVDRATLGLTRLPCAERAGIIFAILTPGLKIDVDTFYGAMLAEFDAIGFDRFAYIGTRAITGPNWKIAFDGNLEGYHFASLHPTTIHPRTYSNLMHFEAFGPHLRIGFAQTTIAEKLAAVPRQDWATQENNGFDFVRTLFPNVSVFLAPEIIQLMLIFPGPTQDINHTTMIYVRRDAPRDEADRQSLEQMMDWLRDVVRDEDYAMGLKVQKGLLAKGVENLIFGRNERGNQFFHEYIGWYLTGQLGAAPAL